MECRLKGEGLDGFYSQSYRKAWMIGKQGCLGICRSFWGPRIFNLTWYFICDGSDPIKFLTLYPYKKTSNVKPIIISFWELYNGYWIRNKCRILYKTNKYKFMKTFVLEGLEPEFYDALITCLMQCSYMIEDAYTQLDGLRG